MKKDIFDVISPDPDVFDEIETEESSIERMKQELINTLEKFDSKERKKEKRELSDELKEFIRSEISKIKPKQNVIQKEIIHPVPVHIEPKVVEAPPAPPQIIKEVRIEVQKEKPIEDPRIQALEEQIKKLERELRETRDIADRPLIIPAPGGPGVIGIPPPEPNPEGYVLTVNSNKKAEWKESTGGSSTDVYTVSNGTTDRSFDANDTSLDEIADVLGSLIQSLQGAGIIQ